MKISISFIFVLNENYHTTNNMEIRPILYITIIILNLNKENYYYINDVNYGMSKTLIESFIQLILGYGNKPISIITKSILSTTDR